MRKGEIAFYLAAVAVAIAAFLYAGSFPSDAAYFPRMISIFIILLCAVLAVRSFRGVAIAKRDAGQGGEADQNASVPDDSPKGLSPILKACIMAAMLLAYCIAFPYTGYLIPTVLLTGGAICLYGGRRWSVTLLIAVVVPTALYLIFRFLLLVHFPSDGLFF